MSSISRWSYKNEATVWKILSKDGMTGTTTWAEPFVIKCTWIIGNGYPASKGVEVGANGKEFTVIATFFHEDKRVNHGDRIRKGVHTDADPIKLGGTDVIKSHTDWDMSPFGRKEKDSPDFRSVT